MKSHTIKIGLTILSLIVLQWFLQGWALTAALLLLGIGLAFWFKTEKQYLTKIFLMQLVISVFFLVAILLTDHDLEHLIHNSSLSGGIWLSIIVLVNLLTVFFSVAIPFYVLQFWEQRRLSRSLN